MSVGERQCSRCGDDVDILNSQDECLGCEEERESGAQPPETAPMLVRAADITANMRCSIVVNDPLYEVDDVAIVNSDGDVRITFSYHHPNMPEGKAWRSVMTFKADDKIEVHLTLDEAVAAFYRLERLEAQVMQSAIDLGVLRADMARLAESLGWKG